MNRLKAVAACAGCIILIITQTACTRQKEPISNTMYDLLNTTCTITIYDTMPEKNAKDIISDSFALCKDYENLLSKTIESSDVYKINHSNGQRVRVSGPTNTLIQRGIYFGALSEGKFDITVGKLSNLWDFSGETPHVPPQVDIDTALSTVNYMNVKFNSLQGDGNQADVWMENKNAELDLGGIAKGYIADRTADFLKENGVESAIVNLGGNIVAIGEKEDDSPWNIGIERPFTDRRDIVGSVQVKDKTVVTSGIYERAFKENGVLYHHILDIKTGFPADTDLDSVTLVGDYGKSMDCDALSTICLMLGKDKGLALIEQTDGVEAVFLGKDGSVTPSSGMDFIPAE